MIKKISDGKRFEQLTGLIKTLEEQLKENHGKEHPKVTLSTKKYKESLEQERDKLAQAHASNHRTVLAIDQSIASLKSKISIARKIESKLAHDMEIFDHQTVEATQAKIARSESLSSLHQEILQQVDSQTTAQQKMLAAEARNLEIRKQEKEKLPQQQQDRKHHQAQKLKKSRKELASIFGQETSQAIIDGKKDLADAINELTTMEQTLTTQKESQQNKLVSESLTSGTLSNGDLSLQASIEPAIDGLISGLQKHLLKSAKNYSKNASLEGMQDDIRDLAKRLNGHLKAFNKQAKTTFQKQIKPKLNGLISTLAHEIDDFQQKIEKKILPEAKTVVNQLATACAKQMVILQQDLETKVLKPQREDRRRLKTETFAQKFSDPGNPSPTHSRGS
jgi:hypothetical protein